MSAGWSRAFDTPFDWFKHDPDTEPEPIPLA
jgi:hypothetical protein